MEILGGGGVSYERGSPVHPTLQPPNHACYTLTQSNLTPYMVTIGARSGECGDVRLSSLWCLSSVHLHDLQSICTNPVQIPVHLHESRTKFSPFAGGACRGECGDAQQEDFG